MRLDSRIVIGALVLTSVSITGCASTGSEVACGWDLSTQQGRDASNARLTFVLQWQADHPGTPPPAPDSPFWHGDCPTPNEGELSPPDHEDEGLGDDGHG